MEKELANYRARKQLEYGNHKSRQSYSQTGQSQPQSSQNWILSWFSSRNLNFQNMRWPSLEIDPESNKLVLILKLIFWLLLWGFFIQIEFGTVFLFLSMFYWMYCSMKEGTRKPWEPSAYSVFNENCEAIEGTLSAEQFERELKFGAGAVRKEAND